MKKRIIRVFLCLVLVTLFTGCEGGLFDPEYAIKAPANGLYQGLYDAVKEAVGKEIILKYPSVQGVNTAYHLWDMDGDGVEEAVVFYQPRSKGGTTRVNVLKQINDEWQSVQDLESVGSDVIHADFCDLNGDGANELCLGWRVATTTTNIMGVYQVDNGLLVQRAVEEYSQYAICDINADGIGDLGLALLSAEKQTSSLRFYTLKNQVFTLLGALALDNNVHSYAGITVGNITEKKVGVYLDVYKGTNSMITELVYFQDNKLYNPFAGGDSNTNIATLRHCHLRCTDIDQNGSLEIPVMVHLPGYTGTIEEDQESSHYWVTWRNFNGSFGNPCAVWFYNATRGYYLELASSLQDKLTVTIDTQADCDVFYRWDGQTAGDRLFAIKPFAKETFVAESAGQYQRLFESETTVWGVELYKPAQEFSITLDTLKEKFHLIVE